MLFENKNAVGYRAGGAIGGIVARSFTREGARVFLAGRTPSSLDAVAEEIAAAGGMAEAAPLDVLDREAVQQHAASVVERAGRVDIHPHSGAHPQSALRPGGSVVP